MAVERKHIELASGQDGAGRLRKLKCALTPPTGEIVYRYSAGTQASLVGGLADFLGVLGFVRRGHHDAIVVEPTGGILFCQTHIARVWRRPSASVEVAAIWERRRRSERLYDAPRVPRPASAQQPLSMWAGS